MGKATTIGEVRAYVQDVARAKGITPEEALEQVEQEYEMVCFMGAWHNPHAEVWVPDSMPVSGMTIPGIVIY